jgi:MYXO-CTERM domain-containing protein
MRSGRFVSILAVGLLGPLTAPSLARAATTYVCGGSTCGAGWGTGSDGNAGTSKAAPFKTLAAAIAKMSGGSTLIVGDGTYAEPITGMPNGTASAYTTIAAENDWGVLIDGSHFPDTFVSGISLYEKSYVRIQGFRIKMSQSAANNAPVQVVSSHHIKIVRCSGSYGPVDGNAATFDVGPDCDYVLVEECYAYGGTRYMFIAYWSDHTVFRRNVARNDYWAGSLQSAGFVTYDSVNTAFQNNIALDSSADNTAGGYYGGFWAENKDDHADDTSQTHDGNIVLNIKTSTYAAGISHEKLSGTVIIRNLILWDSDSGYWGDQGLGLPANLLMQNLTIGNTSGSYDDNNGESADGTGVGISSAMANTVRNSLFYLNHSFGIAGYVSSDYNAFFKNGANAGGKHVPALGAHDVTSIDPATGGLRNLPRIEQGSALKAAGEAGAQIGAQVVNRVGVSGTLYGEPGWDVQTDEPLWPFPNEAQIKADMAAYSGRGGTGARGFCAGISKDGSPQTLTKYVWEYLGNQIPAEIYGCTTVTTCVGNDGCCPAGCTHDNDGDCAAQPMDAGLADAPIVGPDGGSSDVGLRSDVGIADDVGRDVRRPAADLGITDRTANDSGNASPEVAAVDAQGSSNGADGGGSTQISDAGPTVPDAGVIADAAVTADAGAASSARGGCSCSTGSGVPSGALTWLALGLLLALRRRRSIE